MKLISFSASALGAFGLFTSLSFGAAIVPGFNTTSDGRNDDGTFTTGGCTNAANGGSCAGTAVNIGFNLNFLGVNFNTLFVNTNGNVTLDAPLNTFTPFGLTAASRQIIAPFFADVDTRNPASGVVTFGSGTFGGNAAFGVNWINVGYFNQHVDKTDSFQLLLVNRADTGAGNFDIVFNYDNMDWETGDASSGVGGLGGSAARVGFSNGTGLSGTSLELPGSNSPGSLIDGGGNALVSNSLNSNVAGRYILTARNGSISTQADGDAPEPGTWALAAGAAVLFTLRRRFARP